MTANGVWAILGIKRTTDRRAIRSAYADRLRAIDVDADPDGFAELREAYEAALARAQRAQLATTSAEPIAETEAADVEDAPYETASEPEPPGAGAQTFHEIAALLAGGDEAPLSDAETMTLDVKMRRLLDFLERAPIDEQQQAEFGVAHILAAAFPHSDSVLDMAADHFGWLRNANALGMPDSVRAIVQRIE